MKCSRICGLSLNKPDGKKEGRSQAYEQSVAKSTEP